MTPEIVFWITILLTVCLAIGVLKIAWRQDTEIEALRLENIELKGRIRALEILEKL